MPKPDLTNPSKLFRSPVAKGFAEHDEDRVERDAGDYGAGIIRGMHIIQRGEARGHERWIDMTMLEQVRDAINAESKGIKARYTHPSMSGDGLGKYLGRFKNATLEGEVVVADLHFSEAAHRSPEGDLASYIMDLAESDPTAAGNSISFEPDGDSEKQFRREHRDSDGRFESPDDRNEQNLTHVRLKRLRASDIVDTPAATEGMFAGSVAAEAEQLMGYALGFSDEVPALSQFDDVDPTRVRGFIERYLGNHDLEIVKKGNAMSETNQTPDQTAEHDASQTETPADEQGQVEAGAGNAEQQCSETQPETTPESQGEGDGAATQPAAEPAKEPEAPGAKFMEAFGDQAGALYFAKGLSFEDAQAEHLSALQKENEQLKARLQASDRGVAEPVEFGTASGEQADEADAELAKLTQAFSGDEARAKRVLELRRQRAGK